MLKPLAQKIAEDKKRKPEVGQKPRDLLVIVKWMPLQMMYGLSDLRLEEELADRGGITICGVGIDLSRHRFQFVLCSLVYNMRRFLALRIAKACQSHVLGV